MAAPPEELPAAFPPEVPYETSDRTGCGCSLGATTCGTGVAPTTMIGTFAAFTVPPPPLANAPVPPVAVAVVVPV